MSEVWIILSASIDPNVVNRGCAATLTVCSILNQLVKQIPMMNQTKNMYFFAKSKLVDDYLIKGIFCLFSPVFVK